MDSVAIQALLPHRPPFLLVDRVVEINPEKIVAAKCVTIGEPFFQGHFPGQPIMPGVLIVEALAQAGALLALHERGGPASGVRLMTIEKARFLRPVVPGDLLTLEVVPLRKGTTVWRLRGEAKVAGVVVASAELLATVGAKG